MPEVAIVGAGAAGLACAAALAGRARPVLVERLPVAGGEHWREPATARLVAAAAAARPRMLLGETAIRWTGESLLVLGVDGAREVRADALVIATGHRPLTRGELGLAGDRCGGVLAAPVALHLLAHGVVIGREPVVLGGGDWALEVALRARERGAEHVTVISRGPAAAALGRLGDWVELHEEADAVALRGAPRVSRLEAVSGGERRLLACDAVVLAEGRVPWRNVDGAIFGGPGVVFAQRGGACREDGASAACGRAAAARALEIIEAGGPAAVAEPQPRIGGQDERQLAGR